MNWVEGNDGIDMPTDGETVLYWIKYGGWSRGCFSLISGKPDDYYCSFGRLGMEEVTHWARVEAPKKKGSK